MAGKSWYSGDGGASADKGDGAKEMGKKHEKERKETHMRHQKARDDMHDAHNAEIAAMAQRHAEEMQPGAVSGAPGPAEAGEMAGGSTPAPAGNTPAPAAAPAPAGMPQQ